MRRSGRQHPPKQFDIRISSRAEAELLNIRDDIAQSNPENAEVFIGKLVKVIDELTTFPTRHPQAPERSRAGGDLRHAILGNYRIVFEVVVDEVHVLTVRHAARRPARDL